MRTLPRPALLLAACLLLPACHWDPLGHTVQVEAQYHNLARHSAAVVVATPDYVLDAQASHAIGRAITFYLGKNVKDLTMVPYSRVQAFVEANPYWTLKPPSVVQKALGVERLIMVDMNDFRTHEQGSTGELLQGLASGQIHVLEAGGADADHFDFTLPKTTQYPPLYRSPVGLPEGHSNLTQEIVRERLIQAFAKDAAGIFYDHEEQR